MERLVSRSLAGLVGPSMADRVADDLIDVCLFSGFLLSSSRYARIRDLSSTFEATRIWRSIDRAILEKNPSTRLSQEPCLGVNTSEKRPSGWASNQALVSFETCAEWLSRISL